MKIRAALTIDSVSADVELELTAEEVERQVALGMSYQTVATALSHEALKTVAQRVRTDLSARAATAAPQRLKA